MFPSAANFMLYFDLNDVSKGYFLLRTDYHHVFSLTSSIATRVGLATVRISVRLTDINMSVGASTLRLPL